MNTRSIIGQVPIVGKILKKTVKGLRNYSYRNQLQNLEINHNSSGLSTKKALTALHCRLSQPEMDWIDRIEGERERLLNNHGPLIDDSFSVDGLYDKGMSIREACEVSKPMKPALLLFLLTREIAPFNVIELGTNLGISSAYIGAGQTMSGKNGQIVTLDASPYRQKIAKEVHQNAGVNNISYVQGLFNDTLHPTLEKLGSIDLAFIDGHHQYQPTLDYFEEIIKYSNPKTVFVFDDINWSDGMSEAWSAIKSDPRLDVVIDLTSVGICINGQQEKHGRFVSEVIDPFY